jgi:hypothetical protein
VEAPKLSQVELEIVRLWKSGKTGREIGDQLRITRSTVQGIVYRLRNRGVRVERAPGIKMSGLKPKRPPPMLPVAGIEVEHVAVRADAPLGVPLLQLAAHHCRAVISSPFRGVRYCGTQRKPESSYCPHHHSLYYVSPGEARRRAAIAAAKQATPASGLRDYTPA